MLTLTEARDVLAPYAGANQDFATRLNLVRERYLKSGNWTGTKRRIIFNVFPDADGNSVITTPPIVNTILGGDLCQQRLQIFNDWYHISAGLSLSPRYSLCVGDGIIPIEGRFTTFKDWTDAVKLRLKFETTETPGLKFQIKGKLDDSDVYTLDGTIWREGETITIPTPSATVTGTSDFDQPPYAVLQPRTNGRVSMYTWDGATETLVASYDPGERNPSFRRYLVPSLATWTEADPGQLVTVCKLAYVPIWNENDEVYPSNIGALRLGLEALQREDTQDMTRANALWAQGRGLLAEESEDDTGAGTMSRVQVEDTFDMANTAIGV